MWGIALESELEASEARLRLDLVREQEKVKRLQRDVESLTNMVNGLKGFSLQFSDGMVPLSRVVEMVVAQVTVQLQTIVREQIAQMDLSQLLGDLVEQTDMYDLQEKLVEPLAKLLLTKIDMEELIHDSVEQLIDDDHLDADSIAETVAEELTERIEIHLRPRNRY